MGRELTMQLGTELCEALGIPIENVYSLDLHCCVNDLATVTVRRYLQVGESSALKSVLERYEVIVKNMVAA